MQCCIACSTSTSTSDGNVASSHEPSSTRHPDVPTLRRTDGRIAVTFHVWDGRYVLVSSSRSNVTQIHPSTVCHHRCETRGQLPPSVLQKICSSILIGWRTIQMGRIHGTGCDEEGENRTERVLCGTSSDLPLRSREIGTGRKCGTGLGGVDRPSPDRNTR